MIRILANVVLCSDAHVSENDVTAYYCESLKEIEKNEFDKNKNVFSLKSMDGRQTKYFLMKEKQFQIKNNDVNLEINIESDDFNSVEKNDQNNFTWKLFVVNIEINKVDGLPFYVNVGRHLILNYIGENNSKMELISLYKFQDIQSNRKLSIPELILFDINRINWFKKCSGHIFDNYWLTTKSKSTATNLKKLRLKEVSEDENTTINRKLFAYFYKKVIDDPYVRNALNINFLNSNEMSYESEEDEGEIIKVTDSTQFLDVSNHSDDGNLCEGEKTKKEIVATKSKSVQVSKVSNNIARINLSETKKSTEEIVTEKPEPLIPFSKFKNTNDDVTKVKGIKKETQSKKTDATDSAQKDQTSFCKDTNEISRDLKFIWGLLVSP